MQVSLKNHLKRLKQDLVAVYFAMLDPRTPWYAKALAAIVVGYAVSPIDLIPDFIPILGYLDDALLLPLGILLCLKLIPKTVMVDSRIKAETPFRIEGRGKVAAVVIVVLWVAFLGWLVQRFLLTK